MKWNKYSFSLLLLLAPMESVADSIHVEPTKEITSDIRAPHYRKLWTSLIPTQVVAQNAGNMGILSVGIGWGGYAKNKKWDTNLLFGYIPKYQSHRGKLTMTLKENYIPWSIHLKPNLSIEPLRCGLYLNTVYGHEFWSSQPSRYPDKYYEFMSTKFRLNIFVGQQLTLQIPQEKRKLFAKSVTFFYEISSCDLYIRSKFIDSDVSLSDILGLSLGLKLQIL